MKYLSAVLILALVGVAHSYDVRVVGKVIQVNKYAFKGRIIWTNAERSSYLNAHRSSAPVTTGQFIPVIVPVADQAIIDDLNDEGFKGGRSDVIREIARRKSQEYKDDKAVLEGAGLSKSAVSRLLK